MGCSLENSHVLRMYNFMDFFTLTVKKIIFQAHISSVSLLKLNYIIVKLRSYFDFSSGSSDRGRSVIEAAYIQIFAFCLINQFLLKLIGFFYGWWARIYEYAPLNYRSAPRFPSN